LQCMSNQYAGGKGRESRESNGPEKLVVELLRSDQTFSIYALRLFPLSNPIRRLVNVQFL